MTENPYPKHIVNYLRYDAWNEGYAAGKVEGYNQALEDALKKIQVKILRKKVSE